MLFGADANWSFCLLGLRPSVVDNIWWLMSFWRWGLLQSMLFWGWTQLKFMPFWGWGFLWLTAFWNWWRFEVDISWGCLQLMPAEIDSFLELKLLIVFQGWLCFMVVGDCSLCLFWELRPSAVKSILGLMLFSFTATSWDLDSSISQMDRPDDVWSGKSSHFLSSILPSPSPSLLPSHPTISGSLLGILDLIPLSFLATSDQLLPKSISRKCSLL